MWAPKILFLKQTKKRSTDTCHVVLLAHVFFGSDLFYLSACLSAQARLFHRCGALCCAHIRARPGRRGEGDRTGDEMRTEKGDRGRRRGESHLRWKQARYLSGCTVQCLAREGALI